ncbi:MAG: helix-turn-helix domain-containing protein [Candidatus Eremiobacteraeota bacterium]|nr:helix-turn-helix domain-containing protein [Candidatus Eremiobacteraeota bacterium]
MLNASFGSSTSRSERALLRVTCLQYGLSRRETEIFEMIIGGKNTTEIAAQLMVSDSTIHSHVRNIGLKLRCTRRSAMVARVLSSALRLARGQHDAADFAESDARFAAGLRDAV